MSRLSGSPVGPISSNTSILKVGSFLFKILEVKFITLSSLKCNSPNNKYMGVVQNLCQTLTVAELGLGKVVKY